ncbi:MAG: NADH dehydrogenase [candidate division NC10 bacterium RBG_16_65_8]|nr:MAG: NADH dehydrogenase [candidate division NC10 bacterium RBG_16_65_8]
MLTRRSIRKYTPEPVPDSLIAEVLTAAMSAPSAGNQQPWHFVVIADRRLREEIPTFHPYAQMVPDAPVAIAVCGDLRLESHKGYWVQDCSAATQNLLLAAHARGLGAVWVGIYPKDERVQRLQKLLGLPAHVIPLALVPMGFPAERVPPVTRFDPSRVHRDRW